jgi:hypothetical protein
VRFVWAIAAFVLAALMIAAGIAQRTVFQGPSSLTAAVHTTGDAPFTVIDGAVLAQHPGSQTVRAAGQGQVFLSYGRADDVKAWLAGATYNKVSLDGGKVVTTVIGPDGNVVGSTSSATPSPTPTPAASATPAPGSDSASTAPMVGAHNPIGSDLWLEQFQQKDLLVEPLQLPTGMSVLIATDGTKPAPAVISVTWPLATTTPWAGPLIVIGGILMLVGVFLYFLAIRHVRRSRGPRRKSPPPLPAAPSDEPEDLSIAEADKGVISSGSAPPTRRSRRAFIAVPLAMSALLFAGCSPDAWPHFGGSASPTPSATVVADDQQSPAVTEPQAEQILARISKTVVTADKKMDAKTAATRLDGAPLAEREANYTIRQNAKGISALAPIPATGLAKGVVLPQAYDGWPRTVMMIAAGSGGSAPSTIMMMNQADPWSNYKLIYTAQLQPSTQIPDLAPSYVGASAVPPDSSFLVIPPNQLAGAYADVLNNGDKSRHAALFDMETDTFLEQTKKAHAAQLAAFNKSAKKGGQTGSMKFLASAGSTDPSALATLDSGAIVAVQVNDSTITKPTSSGAVIFASPEAKALTGTKQSSTGYTTTYSDELFFYVPGQGGANTKIQMLGYASDILSAKVNKK